MDDRKLEASTEAQGVVIGNVVDLFRKPSTTVEVVTQAIVGTSLDILEGREDWYSVRMPDSYQGWIEARALRVYTHDGAAYASSGQVAQVSNLLAFLFHEPDGTSRAPALQVTIGARLEAIGTREGWVQVALPDGSVRWARAGSVTLCAADALQPRGAVQAVIRTARRFLGLPYLWGGTTPLGIDCSGFVQLVHHLNGISLLRDASMQYTQPDLLPVGKEQLQAGDLIFFGAAAITHVGMYIGDGEFIHATAHKVPIVQISRLEEPHWTGLYLGARRPH